MKAGNRSQWLRARALRWATVVLLAVVVAAGMIGADAHAWRSSLVEDGRALPGTTLAGTKVGAMPGGQVRGVARQAADELLDRRVTVEHDGLRWHVTPRELGATTDAAEAADRALEATATAPLVQVVSTRWLGRGHAFDHDVRVRAPDAEVADLVDTIARDVDRAPVDAAVSWGDGDIEVQAGEAGARVDREATAAKLAAALEGGGRSVSLVVAETQPQRTAGLLEAEMPALREALDGALDRVVTVRHGDRRWEVTPRELGAVPDPQPVLDAVLTGARSQEAVPAAAGRRPQRPAAPPHASVPLQVPHEAVDELVRTIAGEVDRDPQDAAIDHSSGWVQLVPDEPGLAVDRAAASERLRAALAGGETVVDLPVDDVAAEVTADDYHQVLLVRQDQRRLYLYVDGEIAREWPVAVGAGGSATPTGTFTIGAMRRSPVWYNPAPDGWGADMPEVVEPGPTNPLGLRALNWERDGRDTLIRFHGTAETWSIGQAASRGCVRMTNDDVVELFDLVEPGATIVSTWG